MPWLGLVLRQMKMFGDGKIELPQSGSDLVEDVI
jgi:hypothetical protein